MNPLYPYPFRISLSLIFCLFYCSCEQEQSHTSSRKIIITPGSGLFETSQFNNTLHGLVPGVDTLTKSYQVSIQNPHTGLRYVYQSAAYAPVWITSNGLTASAEDLLNDLDSLQYDGINPERYAISGLRSQFRELKKGGDLNAAIRFDTSCTRAYLQASHDLLFGVTSPHSGDSLWFHVNDTLWNAPRNLVAMVNGNGQYPQLAAYRSHIPTYQLLRNEYARYNTLSKDEHLKTLKEELKGPSVSASQAVQLISSELPWIHADPSDSLPAANQLIRGFQGYYGLVPTGKVDSLTIRKLSIAPDSVKQFLAANMERLRWLPNKFEDQYVIVNIPLMELFYRKAGDDAFHMRVVVGKPARQTPVLNANMANVVFSPNWSVPPTILKNDVLPGLTRRGGGYLARKGLSAFDRHGHKVNAGAINSKNYKNYTYKQPPGARNALGEVKFNLPNRWDIYLHDTPHRGDFVKRYRAKSSGCVRVEKPRQFAEFILKDIEGRNFDSSIIDSIIHTRKTRFEILKNKIPVHIVYLTAFEDSTGQHLHFIPDIYGRDARLIQALSKTSN